MRARLTLRTIAELKTETRPYEVRDTEVPGLLLRVQPSGARSWYFDYRHHGVRNRRRIGRAPGISPEGARKICARLAVKLGDGVNLQVEKKAEHARAAKAKHETLGGFLDTHYKDWVLSHLKSGAFQLQRLEADFGEWRGKAMVEINTWVVEGWRSRQLAGGKAKTTVNRDLQRLQACLSKAVQWGVLERHPLAGLRRLKADDQERVRYLSGEEEERLMEALVTREDKLRAERDQFNKWRTDRNVIPLPRRPNSYVDHVRPMVVLALNTGLRRGELLALTWSSVDLDARMLTVVSASAKSGKARSVPLNDTALAALTTWRRNSKDASKAALVFPGIGGRKMFRIDTSWAGLMRRAKIENLRFHDCRHHFASRLVQSGVDLNKVRVLLGHADLSTTLRYAHLAPDNLSEAVQHAQRTFSAARGS